VRYTLGAPLGPLVVTNICNDPVCIKTFLGFKKRFFFFVILEREVISCPRLPKSKVVLIEIF
jgi:hypothetical protein